MAIDSGFVRQANLLHHVNLQIMVSPLLSSPVQSNCPITTAPPCLRSRPPTVSSPPSRRSTTRSAPPTTPASRSTPLGSSPLQLEARPSWLANHQPSCRPHPRRASRCKTAGCWVAMCLWKQGKPRLPLFFNLQSSFCGGVFVVHVQVLQVLAPLAAVAWLVSKNQRPAAFWPFARSFHHLLWVVFNRRCVFDCP